MLLDFKVGNFLSFNEVTTFSMEAGRTRNFSDRTVKTGNTRILKFKAIYGANASGKTNLINAFEFFQIAITQGLPKNSNTVYCRIYEDNIDNPSFFEASILLNGIRYTYGFEALLSDGVFTKEWLYEIKGQKKTLVFTRDPKSGSHNVTSYVKNNIINERLRIYADDIQQDGSILFLKLMNLNKDNLYKQSDKIRIYQTLYHWFQHNLSVSYPDDPITQFTYFFDSKGSTDALSILTHYDSGISGVEICDEPTEKVISELTRPVFQDVVDKLNEIKRENMESSSQKTPAAMLRNMLLHSMYIIELVDDEIVCRTLKFRHKTSTSLFSLSEESDGTNRMLDLIEILLSEQTNMVYVIDEISRCLHPNLTIQFIKDFLAMAVDRNIQLIITTHATELLDLKLLRQDEIVFTEKAPSTGATSFHGLPGTRFDKQIRDAYLKGDYQAVPVIS